MTSILKRRSNILIFKRLFAKRETTNIKWKNGDTVRLHDRFRKLDVHRGKKGWTYVGIGTIVALEIGIGIGEFMRSIVSRILAFVNFIEYIEKLEEEGGNKFAEYITYIRRYRKEKKRQKMIGTNVGPGLAWLYYITYLQYVLAADIEDKVKKSGLLTDEERKRLPMKVYELIPRKYVANILENDDTIKFVGKVTIDDKKKVSLGLFSIMDGHTKYFCLVDCPIVLRTMTDVNDIQMAGISSTKYSSFSLPWNKNATVQLFSVDTKLVQLMRFYYTMNSILSLKDDFRKKASLLLYNESEKKPSDVLLPTIKTDLEISKAQKVKKYSLMESKLLSSEEKKDIDYPFHIFVSHRTELNEKESTNMEEYNEKLKEDIYEKLKECRLKVLLEKDCVGKDWLTKLNYAATKCRWIVFLDTKKSEILDKKKSESHLFISHRVAESLNQILESKKVQTVAIVNSKSDKHVLDDLRWVTCIPYEEKQTNEAIDSLLKIIRGVDNHDNNIRNAKELYFQRGEVAVGLAWDYTAHNLSKIVAIVSKFVKENEMKTQYQPKLFICLHEKCKQLDLSNADIPISEGITSPPSEKEAGVPFIFGIVSKNWRQPDKKTVLEAVCLGEYPIAINVIRQMKEDGVLTEDQMKKEVITFCKTVDKIMQMLLPDQTDSYEFVNISDDRRESIQRIENIYRKDELADKQEQILFGFSHI